MRSPDRPVPSGWGETRSRKLEGGLSRMEEPLNRVGLPRCDLAVDRGHGNRDEAIGALRSGLAFSG
ncbi:MAG: hypothetical protein GX885_03555 [Methanomicrobiales archaeon]|nr:hypothetical protein [Methanomicrobiales archaeon]